MVVSNSDIAQRQDFNCRRGDTFTRNLTFTFNGVAVPLTGTSLAMRVIDSLGNVVFVIVPTVAGSVATITETAALMTVAPGNYLYDIQLTNTDASKVTLMQGWFIINKDQTTP